MVGRAGCQKTQFWDYQPTPDHSFSLRCARRADTQKSHALPTEERAASSNEKSNHRRHISTRPGRAAAVALTVHSSLDPSASRLSRPFSSRRMRHGGSDLSYLAPRRACHVPRAPPPRASLAAPRPPDRRPMCTPPAPGVHMRLTLVCARDSRNTYGRYTVAVLSVTRLVDEICTACTPLRSMRSEVSTTRPPIK
jgi:hypothetical protein